LLVAKEQKLLYYRAKNCSLQRVGSKNIAIIFLSGSVCLYFLTPL
jgi:hypothetical protein